MKKIMITSIATAMLVGGAMLYSCTKKDQAPIPQGPQSEYNVSTQDNLLAFNTVDDYKNIADNNSMQEKEKFTNYVSHLNNFTPMSKISSNTEARNSDSDYDAINCDFLKGILNKDAAVQIGNYIYKIAMKKEKVYALAVSHKSEYKDLVKGNTANPNVLEFSTSEDVLDLIEDISTRRKGLFCRDRHAMKKKAEGFAPYGDGYRLDCKVVYQTAGIYFSLEYKVKNQVLTLGVWTAQNASLWATYSASWDVRCGPSGSNSNYCTSCWSFGNEYEQRPYESSRALEHYSLSAQFYNLSASVATNTFSISN